MAKIVMWSGGMDSTLLLWETSRDNPRDIIIALTVKGNSGSPEQRKMEKKARTKLKKKMKHFKNIKYMELSLDSNEEIQEGHQMKIWLATSLLYVANKDEVMIGYIDSDASDFWNQKKDMEEAFNAFMKLRNIESSLSFPLAFYSKGDVIKKLKNLKILKYCWYCGKPKKGKPCGKCMKCMDVKRWTSFPDEGEGV